MYRKKPVVIEAAQANTLGEAIDFAGRDNIDFDEEFPEDDTGWFVWDYLHETWVHFSAGDWIIKGVKGEFYPCRSGIFEATYEEEDGFPYD